MGEYIIENLTEKEKDLLIQKAENEGIDWFPDDIISDDVCVCGTRKDVMKALKIIGRK